MRILVFSDTHGPYPGLIHILREHPACDVIFLGDGCRAVADEMRPIADRRLFMARGNCDFGAHVPDFGEMTAEGRHIFYTHGHLYHVKYGWDEVKQAARNRGADIVLFGHTHVAATEYDNGLYLLNPGSPTHPREGGPSYGVIDITPAGIVTHIVRIGTRG